MSGKARRRSQWKGRELEERQTTVTATIQDIDKNTNNVFLRWPEGTIVGMHVKDPSDPGRREGG